MTSPKDKSPLYDFLTNGWSGWLRITIVIMGCAWTTSQIKTEVLTELKYMRRDFDKHLQCSEVFWEKMNVRLESIDRQVAVNTDKWHRLEGGRG